ncbi:MAG TPA: LOG family protein [Candidatus Acidoferrales bacterium]|nr:LOG family protein [Candidatus Acidoferrales bacterium]
MPPKPIAVVVFGSSRVRRGSAPYEQARELGRELAARGLAVCSGGYGGVMEAVSRGAREAGGHAIGITARVFRSRANPWIEREIRVRSWQERLFELVGRGRGYVVCPGGSGTLVELAVVWELLNKGLTRAKPLVVLGSFWMPVIEHVIRGEIGPSSEGRTRGARVIHLAASPADAARYLGEQLSVPLRPVRLG